MWKFSYIPKKDTCTHCDQCNAKFKGPLSPEESFTITRIRQLQRGAEFPHECLKTNEKMFKNENSNLLCFTFDLERNSAYPFSQHINCVL